MRIFSGIQPTGRKHLGNYIGAIMQYVAGMDRGEAIYCVVDLHAITVPYEPEVLRNGVYDTAALLLAAGLDPERCLFFRQSDVREHTELTWLLNAVTSYGELTRMTQFKDKSQGQGQGDLFGVGIFNYPILMAADILAYGANQVPVGEDQRQHVELARDIAGRFNSRFGEKLVIPEAVIPKVGARIMDLQLPEKKMSTTGGTPQGTIYVTEEPASIRKKFRSAVTDSGREIIYRPSDKPGVSNLLEILAVVRRVSIDSLESEFSGAGYGDLKSAVGDAVVDYLAPVRENYERWRSNPAAIETIFAAGAQRAREIASVTVTEVREVMGIGPVQGITTL